MSKYEIAKSLKLTKARIPWTCHECGEPIEKGNLYYKETLGSIIKPPSISLEAFCIKCGEARIATKPPTIPEGD
jgi:hypothetical protein